MRTRANIATHKTICPNRKRGFGLDTLCRLFILPLLCSACSVTTPIASLIPDDQMETGSVPFKQVVFVDKLTSEDWRRARAAMSVALDPQSTSTAVKWENADTKTSGSFVATGVFTTRNDLVCRPFQAVLVVNGATSHPSGFACRQGPNDWVVEHPVTPERGGKKIQAGGLF